MKKPMKERLKDTGFLLKHSFKVVTKDKDIITPSKHQIYLGLFSVTLIFLALLTFVSHKYVGTGVLILFIVVFLIKPFQFFYNTRQSACQSWIVYNTIVGQDISYKDSYKHTKSQKGMLRLIAFIDLLMSLAKTQTKEKKGIIGVIVTLFLKALEEIWDLLNNYMIPAVVIEQKPLKEIAGEIKSLKTNVPATLTGVFGIDFVGSVIGSMLAGIYFFMFILMGGIGYLMANYMSGVGFVNSTTFTIGINICWIPLAVGLYIAFVLGTVLKYLVRGTKTIYFTIFYTSINRPMEITEDMKGELTNYLLMKEGDFVPKTELTPKAEGREKYINKLKEYISNYEKAGRSEEEIKKFLLENNYKEEDINAAIAELKKG